jgi:hypothetical protein
MPSATMKGNSWQALTGSGQSSQSEMTCKGEDYSEFLICQIGVDRGGEASSVCEQRNAALVRMTLERREEERWRALEIWF